MFRGEGWKSQREVRDLRMTVLHVFQHLGGCAQVSFVAAKRTLHVRLLISPLRVEGVVLGFVVGI